MIPDESKKRIEALTDSELEYEVSRGDKSRFQRDKFTYLKEHYHQRKRAKADSASKEYIKMLKYLLFHNSQYRKVLYILIATTIFPLFGLLQFDFSNLVETELITQATIVTLIKTGPLILLVLFFAAFLLQNRYFINKYKDPSKLTDEELDKLLKYQ